MKNNNLFKFIDGRFIITEGYGSEIKSSRKKIKNEQEETRVDNTEIQPTQLNKTQVQVNQEPTEVNKTQAQVGKQQTQNNQKPVNNYGNFPREYKLLGDNMMKVIPAKEMQRLMRISSASKVPEVASKEAIGVLLGHVKNNMQNPGRSEFFIGIKKQDPRHVYTFMSAFPEATHDIIFKFMLKRSSKDKLFFNNRESFSDWWSKNVVKDESGIVALKKIPSSEEQTEINSANGPILYTFLEKIGVDENYYSTMFNLIERWGRNNKINIVIGSDEVPPGLSENKIIQKRESTKTLLINIG